MISLVGRGLILAALVAAASGSVLGFTAARRGGAALAWTRRLAYLFSGLMVAANLLMEAALLGHDFSVGYVAQVGSRASPLWVTVVSLWSSLEGSILFWGFILGLYTAGTVYFTRRRHEEIMPWVLGVLLACGVFFAFLIAGPANPFLPVANPPMDGPGPNPLLQNHILMVIHPPMLYLGYVGMTVPFAFAAAALFAGRLGPELLKSLRMALLIPWTFLSIGIVLGGWWAYEVLGWGGYWAWDPVENASLLPWLTATAAIHSVMVVERRKILKGWTLTLVLATFLLTILGTFMTRSGIFNSVHSFTQSDIGPTFLAFLALSLIVSVVLLAARIGLLEAEGRLEDPKSRESTFLVNNLLFVMLTFTVLLGTVFPLVVEAVKKVQISVGEPYFNRMAVPLGVAVLFLMGIGPALPWGRVSREKALRSLLPPLAGALGLVAIGMALGGRAGWLSVTLFCAGYTLWVTVDALSLPVRQRLGRDSFGNAVGSLFTQGRRRFGGYVIHLGVVAILIAVAASSTGKVTTETTLRRGGSTTLGPYTLTYLGTETETDSHRRSTIAHVQVSRDGKVVTSLDPRMNHYFTQREPVGTPAVHSTLAQDLYLSVMSIDEGGELLGLRAFINPMVIWIWIGTAILAFGALLSAWPSRRSAMAPARSREPAPAAAEPDPLAGGIA
ncbi:heme lyase CcmF/NrfE family subunit [Vulgatibacter incomptus]|uniref:Cytochrome c heme lyase subunit CcmF n=1 Tax=Vulgatibacter incomptus TaxID=1391653 RepID=A0A0K1P8H2_9BACT|nr:heme lyase CcmF/NrfE family subunit [Vulgatibacter incomptus]AKU89820.1 Cytochrome c heme lyase subunit CcmF [Vulgatibacter incomptus]